MKGYRRFPDPVEIMKHPEMVTLSRTVTKSMGTLDEESGRTIVPAGFVFPKNDATAEGLILYAIDVTDGDQPAPLLVDGVVYTERLPEAVSEQAMPNLKNIIFD